MIEPELRDRILASPEVLLEDPQVMTALVEANARAMGQNIVDLRGIAMQRLETRLERLEDTHRSVIAAAYDNLAGTNLIHRAILELLSPTTFEEFLKTLAGPLMQTLRVDSVRLVLESHQAQEDPALKGPENVLAIAPNGFSARYLAQSQMPNVTGASITLREVILSTAPQDDIAQKLHGRYENDIRSEALLRLDLGPGRLSGLLVLGSIQVNHFRPNQATDLLAFFSQVFERIMRRWLA